MRLLLGSAAALAVAAPACAQSVALKPLVEARLRYENVDQQDLAENADALTLRIRAGVEAASGPWHAIVEAQGTMALVDDYYDGLHGAPLRPLVADPENVAIHRAQLQYKSRAFTLTAGRQRIGLDDERFVGTSPFRQNAQSFDAVRAEVTPLPGLK
ncbi:MAG TPA: alginate export family protein, partial [Sphingomonas sp.]|nr:alginate export family protein [Sphingomonas sp.]